MPVGGPDDGRRWAVNAVGPQRTRAFALGGWTLTVIGAGGAIGLRIVDPAPVLPTNFGFGDLALVGFALMAVTFASVGALLMIRRPDNAVGWLMVTVGLSHGWAILAAASTFSAAAVGTAYGDHLTAVAGWFTLIFTMLGGFLWPLLPLILPTGRGQTRAWDRFVRGYVPVVILSIAMFAIQPGRLHLFQAITNPFGIGPDLRPLIGVSFSTLVVNGSVLIFPVVAISVISRYRSADHVVRQQLKWFLLASLVAIAGLAVAAVNAAVTAAPVGEAGVATFGFAGALVPVAIGIAILRHRLYDIDRIITRTVSWAVVTGVLGAVFIAGVVALQTALAGLTQGQTLSVAASTLGTFALFQPVRRLVQAAVDRRFDRARYDAERTVGGFAERLRFDEDLDGLGAALATTAHEAVRPAGVGVWIRRGPDGSA